MRCALSPSGSRRSLARSRSLRDRHANLLEAHHRGLPDAISADSMQKAAREARDFIGEDVGRKRDQRRLLVGHEQDQHLERVLALADKELAVQEERTVARRRSSPMSLVAALPRMQPSMSHYPLSRSATRHF
ncbi:MAG: hypothetical protein HC882_03335 [Acidobacteria bacterium]|nr:hypothetical protein [Acidobacteriota bacterium]